MKKEDRSPDPLPREWLPDSPVPPGDDAAYWDVQLERLMAQAEPTLAGYRRPAAGPQSWLDALATRWRPAVASALALAVAAVLVLALSPGRPAMGGLPDQPEARTMTLSTIVSGGEPAALWQGAGVPADPTLALLVLETGARQQGGER